MYDVYLGVAASAPALLKLAETSVKMYVTAGVERGGGAVQLRADDAPVHGQR